MNVTNTIMRQYLLELILSHLSDEILDNLKTKVPQKQSGAIVLRNHNETARKKCIKLLTNIKNIDYVSSFLESGQVHIKIEENYLFGEKLVSFVELEEMIRKNGGLQLGYLIFVIEKYKLVGLNGIFFGNPDNVKKFKNFLSEIKLQDYIIKNENPNIVGNKYGNNEFEIKYNELRKRVGKFKHKEEKNKQYQKKILTQLHEQNSLYKEQSTELKNVRNTLVSKDLTISEKEVELDNLKRLLGSALKKNNKLKKDIEALTNNISILKKRQKSVLVIGNLPDNSILDNFNYHITVLPNTIKFNETVYKSEFVKVYIQSEYVSIGEYYDLKNRFTSISFEYTSRNNMIGK